MIVQSAKPAAEVFAMIGQSDSQQHETWPRAWRLFVVAMGVLILSACHAPLKTAVSNSPCPTLPCSDSPCPDSPCPDSPCPDSPCPAQACPAGMMMAPGMTIPLGGQPRSGNCRSWANDEFIVDGGDFDPQVQVRADWEVLGLTPEETVAHFDTLDGQTIIEPSNRVCIYAPRFCAVRKVEGVVQNEQSDSLGDVNKPVRLVRCDEVQEPISSKQHIQPGRNANARPPLAFLSKQGDGAISTSIGPKAFQDAFQPYENIEVIRTGLINRAESAWLAQGTNAAITWCDVQAVQIILDQRAAQTDVGVQDAQVTYTVDNPPANPKLRLIKIASTKTAKPGDTVDFTLRFDNVGNQLIGNVTIIDNLTTRLEFIPLTVQCSLPANFIVKKNTVGSDILRWELKDPLDKAAGGIIRFKCRVR